MFEAYSVAVKIVLHDLVSQQLILLAKEFEKLDGLTVALNKSLGKITVDSTGLRSLATATNATNRAFGKAALSAGAYESRLASIHRLGGAIGTASLGPRGPGGGGGGGGGSGGGFHGGNIHMGPGGIGLGTVGMAAGDWFVPLAATGAMMYASKSLFESAKELDIERQRFKLLGLSDSQNADAFKFVDGIKVYGTTRAERMAAFTEAQGVGRESGYDDSKALEFAKLATPVLSRLDALGKGLDDETMNALHASNVALLRFDEQAGGLKSASEFNRIANIAYKLRQSSGGTIDFGQLRAVTSQGGAYTQNKTAEGWAYAEPIIQELGGARYGTGVATAGQRLFNVMSKTPKNLIELATKFGLWTPERQHLNEADSKLFKENFEKFYITRLMPLYDKFNQSPTDRIRDNAILLGRTGANAGNLVEKQVSSIMNSYEAYKKSKSLDDATKQLPDSLTGQQKEFDAAWTDFKANFGTKMLPFFTGVLNVGSQILRVLPDKVPFSDALSTAAKLNPLASILSALSDPAAPKVEHVNSVSHGLRGWTPPPPFQFDANAPSMFGNPLDLGNSPAIDTGKGSSTVNVRTQINMDGRKVAEAVTTHQARSLAAPIGGANFDGTLTTPSVAMNHAH